MSSRITSDEQLEAIDSAMIESGFAPIRTKDRWGDDFAIFEGWDHVGKVRDLIVGILPVELVKENEPSDPDHLEWAIGEFGFSDQYTTCEHCYTAIQTDDPHPHFYVDYDAGFVMCGDCVRSNPDFAEDYLNWLARHVGNEQTSALYKHWVDPADHGFVCLNADTANKEFYGSSYDGGDHPAYDSRLTWANEEEIRLFAKAARLVDPNLQIVYNYSGMYSGGVIYWARFDPSANIEYPYISIITGSWEWDKDPLINSSPALGYVLGLVFAKFGILYNKRGIKQLGFSIISEE